jgi:nucleoside-diphosphate-sugar epimerase
MSRSSMKSPGRRARLDESPLDVVLGAGQLGVQVAEKLVARGERVRLVRRRDGPPVQGTDVMYGDLRDVSFAEDAIRGATVVYQCAVPSHDPWLVDMPSLIRGVLHGTTKAGAHLIVLDNLYMYGAVSPYPIAEDAPIRPISRKGSFGLGLAGLRHY